MIYFFFNLVKFQKNNGYVKLISIKFSSNSEKNLKRPSGIISEKPSINEKLISVNTDQILGYVFTNLNECSKNLDLNFKNWN